MSAQLLKGSISFTTHLECLGDISHIDPLHQKILQKPYVSAILCQNISPNKVKKLKEYSMGFIPGQVKKTS